MWTRRGDNPNEHNNKATIAEMVSLRTQRAKLLGYPSHAHWIVDDNMAKTPEAAMALMMKVWKAAVGARAARKSPTCRSSPTPSKANQDRALGLPLLRREGAQGEVRPRPERGEAVPPARQAPRGMFWAAGQVYGLSSELGDVPVYHPDMTRLRGDARRRPRRAVVLRSLRARRQALGRVDERVPHAGALHEPTSPIVSNNSNFMPGKAGEPVLISWDDAETMFHEFGHALHGLQLERDVPDAGGHHT
jgi:peptidyl-dipeptidase Dcp